MDDESRVQSGEGSEMSRGEERGRTEELKLGTHSTPQSALCTGLTPTCLVPPWVECIRKTLLEVGSLEVYMNDLLG